MSRTSMICTIIAVFAALTTVALAQVQEAWVARYNGPGNDWDGAAALVVDDQGNVYVTGGSRGTNTGTDYATVKYSPDGEELWVARYSGPGNIDHANALTLDNSGNIYVTGESWNPGTGYDFATIKYSPGGEELWVRRYDGPGNDDDKAYSIAVDVWGNVCVTGVSEGDGTGEDIATVKYSPDGDRLWVRRYNGPRNASDAPRALAFDELGNVYVTGFSAGPGAGFDYVTIKYDPDGDRLWVRNYDGPGNGSDVANAIAVRGQDVFVTGSSQGDGTGVDYATIRYSPNGDELWVARYEGPDMDWARALAVDGAGNVYVTGMSEGSGTDWDYATIKYSPDGEELWVARYNGPGNHRDEATALAFDGQGNVYVTGYSTGSDTEYDYATVKYSPEGEELWVARYNGPGNLDDRAVALAVDGQGNVYVTGGSEGDGTGFDYATIKYVQTGAVAEGRPAFGPVPGFSLDDGSPNPFSSRITIRYSLPAATAASFRIYDAAGRLVRELSARPNVPGAHTVTWDGRDEQGRDLSTGVYLVRLTAGDMTATRKVVKTE